MPAALARSEENIYYKLVRHFPLRPIRSEVDHKRAEAICDELTDNMSNLSRAEADYLEVLSELIAKYESRWESEIAQMNPRQLIQYLMEQNDLSQNDLVSEFGSPSRISEFLSGKRQLSLKQAKNLSQRFKLKLSTLIE